MRILVADDDAALASFVKKGLEAERHAVDIAPDGEESQVLWQRVITTSSC